MLRKVLLSILTLLLGCTVAAADVVSQQPYTLITDGYIREGTYTGDVINGRPEGYGVFCTVNDAGVPWHYIGMWAAGVMHGYGGTYWDNGSMEIGEYRNGVLTSGAVTDGDGDLAVGVAADDAEDEQTYIGNRNTKKFHLATCGSVSDMKESNKVTLGSRSEAIDSGYKPCGRCKP